MKIAIVTVNFNGKSDTLDFLGSHKKLRTNNYELITIVVDNGSTDGSVGAIVAQYPEVDILQNGSNEGFSGGYNRGMLYGYAWGADYILVINNDTLIKDGNLLEDMVGLMESDKDIGIISPKIYFAPGFEFHKDKYKKDEIGKVIWYGGGKFDWDNVMAVHRGLDEVDSGKYDGHEVTDFVTGCCLFVKREVLEKAKLPAGGFGFFDDELFLYFEDLDFTKRAKEAGFKSYYDGKVAIYHKASQSTGIGSEITDFFHTRNRLVVGFRYGSPRTKFALIREAFKFLIFGRQAQKMGVWDFFKGKRGGKTQGVYLAHPGGVQYQLKLSICIVSYNTADLTKKLLESIFNKDSGFDPGTMEVLVLDNGSEDNCKEVISDFLPKIKYMENSANEGFSKGYNKAIAFSKGEHILLLNADIEVLPNALTEMVKHADQYGGKAVLGGKLFFPNMDPQDSVYKLPTVTGAFNEYFLGNKDSYFMYQPATKKPTKVEGLVMACFLIPKKVINKVGLLDEGTFIFFEDIEYSRRLKEYGVPLYYIPTAKFIHHHGGATKKIGQEKAYALLQKGAKHYHGSIYYKILSWVLRIGQKLGRTKTPISRWTK